MLDFVSSITAVSSILLYFFSFVEINSVYLLFRRSDAVERESANSDAERARDIQEAVGLFGFEF